MAVKSAAAASNYVAATAMAARLGRNEPESRVAAQVDNRAPREFDRPDHAPLRPYLCAQFLSESATLWLDARERRRNLGAGLVEVTRVEHDIIVLNKTVDYWPEIRKVLLKRSKALEGKRWICEHTLWNGHFSQPVSGPTWQPNDMEAHKKCSTASLPTVAMQLG